MVNAIIRDVHVETKIIAIECAACSVDFGIGDGFMQRRLKDHQNFYCPNGHVNYFPQPNEQERLKQQLEASRSLAQREARRREAAERSARAYKGQATKLRKHAAAGECPAGCGKTYKRLASHMSAKHPGFEAQE